MRAKVGGDHRGECATYAERDRNEDVFEPRGDAIGRDRQAAKSADESGGSEDRRVAQDRAQRRGQGNAQHAAEVVSPKLPRRADDPHRATAARQERHQAESRHSIARYRADGSASDTERRQGFRAKHQHRAQQDVHHGCCHQRHCRRNHARGQRFDPAYLHQDVENGKSKRF